MSNVQTNMGVKQMLINLKHKADKITMDLRCKQVRYLKDVKEHGQILFMDLSNSDVEAYEYLYEEHKKTFFKCLKEDLFSFLCIDIDINKLEEI